MNVKKMYSILSAFLLFIGAVSISEAAKKLKFDPDYRLYSSDLRRYSSAEIDTALRVVEATGKKSAIIFIHGRGNEPKKSLKGTWYIPGGANAVNKIEAQYDAPVIMFNWKSKTKGFDRTKPLARMPVAAEELHTTITALRSYQQNTDSPILITLLVHSMGSIVVENMVRKFGWPKGESLFQAVVFTGADADSDTHQQWMSEIGESENVFVVLNKDDRALRRSKDERRTGVLPLGRDVNVELAENVSYVDITGLGKKRGKKIRSHEIFNKKAMKSQVNICDFFNAVLNGELPMNENKMELYPKGILTNITFLKNADANCFD